MPVQFHGVARYTTFETYFNKSFYARLLTPIPESCPTQMGTKGPQNLPPVDQVVDKLYKRTKFVYVFDCAFWSYLEFISLRAP